MSRQYRVLLIGGWAFSEKIWQPLTVALSENASSSAQIEAVETASWQQAESRIDALSKSARHNILQKKPLKKTIIVAWSLGGFKALNHLLTMATDCAAPFQQKPPPMLSQWCGGFIGVCVNYCFASTVSSRAALRAMIFACTTRDRCQTMLKQFVEKATLPHSREAMHNSEIKAMNSKANFAAGLLEKQKNEELRHGLHWLQRINLGSKLKELSGVAPNDQTMNQNWQDRVSVADLGVPMRLVYGKHDAILGNTESVNGKSKKFQQKNGNQDGVLNGKTDAQVWQHWLAQQNAETVCIDDGHLLPWFSSQRLVEQINAVASAAKNTQPKKNIYPTI